MIASTTRCSGLNDAIRRTVLRAALGRSRIPFVPPPRALQTRLTAGVSESRVVRIDFGDGECVEVRLKHQPDFSHMLHSVGAAGVRRRAANGFPTNDAPLVRQLDDVDDANHYLIWPKPNDKCN